MTTVVQMGNGKYILTHCTSWHSAPEDPALFPYAVHGIADSLLEFDSAAPLSSQVQ
jgi:hypothetical protein